MSKLSRLRNPGVKKGEDRITNERANKKTTKYFKFEPKLGFGYKSIKCYLHHMSLSSISTNEGRVIF